MSAKEYITHDYSIINKHIDEVYLRNKELTNYEHAKSNFEHFKNTIFLILGIGFFLILLSIAYKIFVYPLREDNQVEREVEKVFIKTPDPLISKIIEKSIIVEKPVVIPIEIPVKDNVVTNFTIFINENTNIDGIDEVITGANYTSSDVKLPFYQWCYTANPRNKVSSAQIKLATKSERGSVQWLDITKDDASQYGSTVKNLNSAKDFCNFIFEPAISSPSEELPDLSKVKSSGTGFIINQQGHIVTNNHVVKDCSAIWVENKSETFNAVLLHSNENDDIAILQTHDVDKNIAFTKFSERISTGQNVAAFGFPFGDELGNELKITKGNISAMGGIKGDKRFLQFTAPIQPGNSGGPLLDEYGFVVGMNTASLRGTQYQNINFAIKGTEIQSFLGKKRIPFDIGVKGKLKLKTEDLVTQANRFTFQIKCY
jgi:S1-C subfamily serine protease